MAWFSNLLETLGLSTPPKKTTKRSTGAKSESGRNGLGRTEKGDRSYNVSRRVSRAPLQGTPKAGSSGFGEDDVLHVSSEKNVVMEDVDSFANLEDDGSDIRRDGDAGGDVGDDRRESRDLISLEAGGNLTHASAQARRAARRRGDSEEPTEEEIEIIRSFKGAVYTAKTIAITPESKEQCALLDNGWFLINRDDRINPAISAARTAISRTQFVIKRTFRVSLPLIRTVYDNYDKATAPLARDRDTKDHDNTITVLSLIEEAFASRASDIHIVYRNAKETEVELRINGELELLRHMPGSWGEMFCSAAFALGEAGDSGYMPTKPQGIRIPKGKIAVGLEAIRLAFSPLPNGGRYLVMRLLPEGSHSETRTLSTLGYKRCHIRDFTTMRRQPEGVIIVAGPTNSGKSTTLCIVLAMDMHDAPGRNVITIEDPPEYAIPGSKQLAIVNAHTTAEREAQYDALINITLRQDPDTVLVSEIRDKQSGIAVFKLAMSGHRVYTTTHANSAFGVTDRLRGIDLPSYDIVNPDMIAGWIGQRLVRKLCPHCSIPLDTATPEQLDVEGIDSDLKKKCLEIMSAAREACESKEKLDQIRITNHSGCPHCRRGVSGRRVVAETVAPDYRIMEKVRENDMRGAIKIWLDDYNGMTMHEHALQGMVAGIVSPRDVINMTGDIMKFDMSRAAKVFGELMED